LLSPMVDTQSFVLRQLTQVETYGYSIIFDLTYTVFCNSGYWLFHCHLEFHMEIGMGLIFKVGGHEEFPPVPESFPSCGDWLI
jgi:hypothetical protein